MKRKNKFKLSAWKILALGYFLVIITGSVLLILPFATRAGVSTTYLNALFTATSATCVTGLVPYDTAIHWSAFGQIVILLLIQFGGLGFMTFVSVVFLMFKRGMGLYGRAALMQSAGGRKLFGISSLVKRIIIGTAVCEFLGAVLLCIRFIPDFGALKGIYFSIWHSVSAFCNAGFDLMGAAYGEFSSLTAYAVDPLVSLTVCALIIMGGLGFCVWGDVLDCKLNFKKFQLNTKIVLLMNGVLLVAGTGLYLLFERNNLCYGGYSFGQKLLVSFFNSTTARTAGFAATDLAALSDSGFILTVVLMFIGGSSGSTAGGIKVGTLAVIITGMFAALRGRRDINVGKKRIEYSLLSQALAVFSACLILVIFSTMIICAIEPDTQYSFKQVLFECVSAMGTVGLSMSLTPSLSAISKLIIIILMYAGRVGILTLTLAFGEKKNFSEIRYPLDNLLIG